MIERLQYASSQFEDKIPKQRKSKIRRRVDEKIYEQKTLVKLTMMFGSKAQFNE